MASSGLGVFGLGLGLAGCEEGWEPNQVEPAQLSAEIRCQQDLVNIAASVASQEDKRGHDSTTPALGNPYKSATQLVAVTELAGGARFSPRP